METPAGGRVSFTQSNPLFDMSLSGTDLNSFQPAGESEPVQLDQLDFQFELSIHRLRIIVIVRTKKRKTFWNKTGLRTDP